MPTPAENKLWDLVQQKKFSEIRAHIAENEELINAKHPTNGRNLAIHLLQITTSIKDAETRALVRFVVTHPALDWGFQNKKESAARSLVHAAGIDPDFYGSLMTLLKHTKGLIISNEELTYSIAKEKLDTAEAAHKSRVASKKPEKEIAESKANVDKWKIVVGLIRDISILYALKKDDAVLFDRLEKAGADPLGDLGVFGGGVWTAELINIAQPNPNIKAWRTEQSAKTAKEMAATSEATEKHLKEGAALIAQVGSLFATKAAKDKAALDEHNVTMQMLMKQAADIAGPPGAGAGAGRSIFKAPRGAGDTVQSASAGVVYSKA